MAHHRHRPPVPVATGQSPQPTTIGGQLQGAVIGGPDVVLFTADGKTTVNGQLRTPVGSPLPRPKINIIDRPGRVGLTQWAGRDPYQVTIPIQFDRFSTGHSIEGQIRDLSKMALRDAGSDDLPVVLTIGPVPIPAGMKKPRWKITDLVEVADRTLFNQDGARCRFAVDITLTEHVADDLLESSGTAQQGRTAVIHKGETLHDFAKRVLHDAGKARDIAKANNIKVTFKASHDRALKLP